MSLSIARSLKNFRSKAVRSVPRASSGKGQYRQYTRAATYGASFASMYSASWSAAQSQLSKWWAAATAAPVAVAALWGAKTDNKNDLESFSMEVQEFEKLGEQGDVDAMLKHAEKLIRLARELPDSELQRVPDFVPQVLYVLATFQTSVGHPDATSTVELLYTVARKIDAENKYPEVLRLVYRADCALQAQNGNNGQAKKLLLSELDLLRKVEGTNVSLDQSAVLFVLATLSAQDKDSGAAKYLQESNKIFNGITTATLSSEMEQFWRQTIVNQLQFSFTLEFENNAAMSKVFKTSAKTLYDGFLKVSANKANVPEFKELEVYARMSVEQKEA